MVRIALLIGVGHAGAPELAVGAFHTRMGWVLFCAVALALIVMAENTTLLRRERDSRGSHAATPRRPEWIYVAPLVAFLGVQFVVGSFVPSPYTTIG